MDLLTMKSQAEINVWIIEDHSDFRHTVAYIIDNEPNMACTETFPDYESAKRFIEKRDESNPPDVVLMDYNLPGMNGVEGLKHLKQHLPTVSIIMLTIEDDEDLIYEALRAGASGYLTKNSSLDKMISAVKESSQGGTLMPSGVARKVLKFFTDQDVPKEDYGLTPREKEILQLMGEGLAHKQIAHNLFLSYHTVDSHVRNIYRKLHVRSGIEAVAKAYKERLF